MKKIAKKIIIAVLVLSMVLGIFAGCQNPSENKSLAEKYGITMDDKTFTYDGKKHELGISIDNTILQGKSYEVTYDVNGTVVTKVEYTDAGEYKVTANVKVAGDETVYPLTKTLTIKKADLTLEVGNLFLRQLQGVATLGNPRDLFKDANFVGDDTNSILGTLSFEVYNGGSKVNDLSTLKPTDKVSSGLTVKVTGMKDLKNYNVKLSDGKLYVLAGTEYDNAKLLKEEIATVPTSTTINTLDFNAMRAFAQGADHIVSAYPSINDIQRLMCGTVDVNTVKTLKKTADTRVANVYDFDDEMETSVGKVVYLGASHDKNEIRNPDDRLTELKSSEPARARGEYGDILAFEVVIYDTLKYKFTHVLINGVEYTTGTIPRDAVGGKDYATGTKVNNPKVYSYGKVRYTTPVSELDDSYSYGIGAGENPGALDGLKISNVMLGALSGKTSLTIEVVAGEVHDAGIYLGIKEIDSDSTAATEKDGYPQMSDFTITGKGEEKFRWTTNDTNTKKADLVVGKEYKFTITPNAGYGVVSVEVGDKLILASAMDNGSFTITLTEDHLFESGNNSQDSVVKIVPTFEKVYSFEVKTNTSESSPVIYRTLSNSNKDGVFSIDSGTIKLIGVSQTTIPTIPEEKALSLSILAAEGWLIKSVKISQEGVLDVDDIDKDENKTELLDVDISDEFEGSSTVPLDMSDPDFRRFDSKKTIAIKVEFRESYPVVVKSTYNDKTITMTKKTDGSYVSDYGSVEVLSTKKDNLTMLAKGSEYYIRLVGKTGYVPKSIKINGKSVASTTMENSLHEGVRYPMILNDTNIIINLGFKGGSASSKGVPESPVAFAEKDKNFPLIVDAKIDAGEDFVIEIEYEAYYFIDISDEVPSSPKAPVWYVEFSTYLTLPKSGELEYQVAAVAPDAVTINHRYSALSGLIKVQGSGTSSRFYCYFSDTKKIKAGFDSSALNDEQQTNYTGKYLDTFVIIGCEGDEWESTSAGKALSITIDEAIKIPSRVLTSAIANKVQKKPILPGAEILIRIIIDDYEVRESKN